MTPARLVAAALSRYHCPSPVRVSAFADGEGAEEEREAVRAHLAGCAACAGEVGERVGFAVLTEEMER